MVKSKVGTKFMIDSQPDSELKLQKRACGVMIQ